MTTYRRIEGAERGPGTGQLLRHVDDPYRWQIRVFIGREDGKKRYVSRVIRGHQQDAEEVLAELVAEASGLPKLRVDPKTSVREYLLEHFLPERRETATAATVEFYEWLANKYLIPKYGRRSISSITLLSIEAFDRLLRVDGVGDRARDAAVKLLRSIRRHAVEQTGSRSQYVL